MILEMKLGSSLACCLSSLQTETRRAFWSSLSSLGTNLAEMRLILKFSAKMRWTAPYDSPTISQTSWIVCLRSARIASRTFAVFSGAVLVDGRPERLSSSTDVRQSLKRLYHDMVPNDSCHKTAAIRYFGNRLMTYKLTPKANRRKETRYSKSLPTIITKLLLWASAVKRKKHKQDTRKGKWAKFTYTYTYLERNEVYHKLFKSTDVKVTFNTDNTGERRLATRHETEKNTYNKSGIYQLTCPDCKMKYAGQTGNPSKLAFRNILEIWNTGTTGRGLSITPWKQKHNRPNGRGNECHPHNQQGQNDGHFRKILHL